MSQISSPSGNVQPVSGWSRPFDGWTKAIGDTIRTIKHRIRLRYFALAATTLAKLWIPDNSKTKLIIIPDCFGRLANRLTVLANVLAYAKANDAIVLDLSLRRELNADCFDLNHQVGNALLFTETRPRRSLIAVLLIWILGRAVKEVERLSMRQPRQRFHGIPLLRGDMKRVDLQEIPTAFPQDRCIVLTGILLDSAAPSPLVCEELRELFRPHDQAQAFVDHTLNEAESGRTIVGVHVRHGDYREWQDGRYFHPLDEYVQCMHVLQDALPATPTFLLVSDAEQDMSLCGDSIDAHRVRGNEQQDLALLARCDFIIATHSSFANWASFLGKIPILTVRDGLNARDQLDLNDLKVVDFPTLQSDYIV